MYYTQEQIDHANQADLVSFLQSQGEQLTRAGNEYRWKRHDSLTVRGNKWYRHSQSKGGGPVDFLMEFFGKSFTEAVELLTGEKGAAPPPDSPAPLSDFRLPPRSPTAEQVKRYLTEARRIDEDVTGFFISSGDIYEEAHRAELTLWNAASRYLHANLPKGTKTLPISEWEKEYATLSGQRTAEYTKLKETRAEVAELHNIRKCVDIALKADQPEQTRAKRHDLER